MHKPLALVAIALASCAALHARALPLPGEPPAAQPAEPSPLSGPRVAEPGAARGESSIVAYDFDSNVVRPEASPEEAAAQLLALEGDAKDRVDVLLRERLKILDTFVAHNLDLLTKFGNAEATGNALDKALLLAEAARKLVPLWKRGTLQSEIEKVLPEERKPEYTRLLDEYYHAVRDETLRNTGEKKALWTIRLDERMKALGREIERSVKRQLYNGEILFQYITPKLHLRPEQEARVHEVCAKFAEELSGNDATKAQQVKFVFDLGSALDNDQRKILGQILRGEQAKKAGKTAPKPTATKGAKPDPKPAPPHEPNAL